MDREEYEDKLVDALTAACDLLGEDGCPYKRLGVPPLDTENSGRVCEVCMDAERGLNASACWLLHLMKGGE